jgi:hypothetical protein
MTNAVRGWRDHKGDKTNKETDLLLFILISQTETIFVNTSFSDVSTPKACWNFTHPCSSLNVVLSDLVTSFDNKLYVQNKLKIENGNRMSNVEFKPRDCSAQMETQEIIQQTEYFRLVSFEKF